MNIGKTFDLTPSDSRKSFYGKARVTEKTDGSKILTSYTTDVCMIDKNGNFKMLWEGKTQTTSRHIKAFKVYYGIE